MAIEYGTKLTYCTVERNTTPLKVEEFYGPGHSEKAQNFLKSLGGEIAQRYHVFETQHREV